ITAGLAEIEEPRVTSSRVTRATSAVAVEVEVRSGRGDQERMWREVHLLRGGDDGIAEDTTYCTGIWDGPAIARHAAEAPMGSRRGPRPVPTRDRAPGREPLDGHDGRSGAVLERVVLDDGTKLVVKTAAPGADLPGAATNDPGRELWLWSSGILGQLPAGVGH